MGEVDIKAVEVEEPNKVWGSNSPYKQLREAKSVVYRLYSSGVKEVDVIHPDMRGVTPADMLWFWRRSGDYVRRDHDSALSSASELSVYRLWHQRDHIRVFREEGDQPGEEPEFVISKGGTFRIEEVIQ